MRISPCVLSKTFQKTLSGFCPHLADIIQWVIAYLTYNVHRPGFKASFMPYTYFVSST